ncbi:UDP-N-acetylmuramate--L-alanine ligase [Ornithinicoccus halotolerans]|uniref:UDP-N-acetylmuramate--L-alanine ligase n=1 Tax=Ornithinicoccus halotolerans TaxID=1748220 RepID=UPI001E46CB98|nr:UDP-N-acetylmuramate--L-alanine ligase [Ornithinicoccus halotolerans]
MPGAAPETPVARAQPRFDFTAAVPPAEELDPVHFIAIGGTGVSGVARLYLARGATVTGSDAKDSAVLHQLRHEGATVHVGHHPAHLGQARTVVISGAVRESNPELAEARRRGLPVLHRAQAIAALLSGPDGQPAAAPGGGTLVPVAVAGANGKTTTSAMLTVGLRAAGADPSYLLGAPITGLANAGAGTGRAFVVEADESDGSFLAYRPQVAVVTNIKADHLDFYGDLAAIEAAYAQFAGTLRPGGLLVACADDDGARRLAAQVAAADTRVLTYGTAQDADLVLEQVALEGMTSRARLRWGRDLAGLPAGTTRELVVPVPGEHNLLDAAAALLAATEGVGSDVDVAVEAVLAGLAGYPGTHRRFEPQGTAGGVTVVDDYAHNPDKVAAVVRAGRAVAGDGRLVVAFQPHLYSRTAAFAAEFAAALAPADQVLLLDVFGAREDPMPGVTGGMVADALARRDDFEGEVGFEPERAQAATALAGLVRPGDLVLTVGAGDVTGVGPELLDLLGQTEQEVR